MLSEWLREYLHSVLGGDKIWEMQKILVKWEQNKFVAWLFVYLPPEEMRPKQKHRAPNFKKEALLPQPVIKYKKQRKREEPKQISTQL